MPKRLVALDTEVVIIAAGGETPITNGRERALQMVFDHMDAGDHVYIPAPAFAECCEEVKEEPLSKLRIANFNAAAARIASRIHSAVKAAGRSTASSTPPSRQALKVDAMILATAEALRADLLYVGEDDWFANAAKAAGLRVEIRTLPELRPEQLELRAEDEESD